MTVVLVTGMSGVGKSAALDELERRAIAWSTPTSTAEIDTQAPLAEVAHALERIAGKR